MAAKGVKAGTPDKPLAEMDRAELETELTAAQQEATGSHIAVRDQALRLRTDIGLCRSGVDEFLHWHGLPGTDLAAAYDGKLRPHPSMTVSVNSPYGSISPAYLTEEGLRAAVLSVREDTAAWLKAVRERIIYHIKRGDFREPDARENLKAAGIELKTASRGAFSLSGSIIFEEILGPESAAAAQARVADALKLAAKHIAGEDSDPELIETYGEIYISSSVR